mmetsp:Transcript_63744/g.201615  ORF Transcript_63744/g.201615 Transcript_63744/m.201615 type:complete len:310 (+) Transcript_63744:813-1742(+)
MCGSCMSASALRHPPSTGHLPPAEEDPDAEAVSSAASDSMRSTFLWRQLARATHMGVTPPSSVQFCAQCRASRGRASSIARSITPLGSAAAKWRAVSPPSWALARSTPEPVAARTLTISTSPCTSALTRIPSGAGTLSFFPQRSTVATELFLPCLARKKSRVGITARARATSRPPSTVARSERNEAALPGPWLEVCFQKTSSTSAATSREGATTMGTTGETAAAGPSRNTRSHTTPPARWLLGIVTFAHPASIVCPGMGIAGDSAINRSGELSSFPGKSALTTSPSMQPDTWTAKVTPSSSSAAERTCG